MQDADAGTRIAADVMLIVTVKSKNAKPIISIATDFELKMLIASPLAR